MKIESHMLKHYIENHEDEEIRDMEFGMRIVRKPRTAFNRQIAVSVMIQSNKNHHILNSKSEYNRCALPRLATRIGEESLEKIEKLRREEKKAEDEYEKNVKNLRMRKSRERREKPTQMDQPAEKRRRLGENEYKRVIQNSNKQEKRKDEEVQVENKPKTFQIFNIKRRKMNETPEIENAAQEVIEIEERDWDRAIWLREE